MHESYKERNAAFQRQGDLICEGIDHGIPMLIHDGDHKMMGFEIKELQRYPHFILTASELAPRPGFERLLYPNHHKIYDPHLIRLPFMGEHDLIYIGNNYERWDQFLEYIAKPADLGLRTACYGNWLDPHPDRQSPKEVKEAAPNVKFLGRISQNIVIEKYFGADCTVHLAKPSYCETGFITMRWAEAASAGTLGFIPREFKHTPERLGECVVRDGADLFRAYGKMKEAGWFHKVKLQQEWVNKNMTFENWLDLIQETAWRT